MEKDTLRMQFLSGVITESEYKVKLQENAAPIFDVVTMDGKTMVGTHQYGVGFKANKKGIEMGFKDDPKSIPNKTKMVKNKSLNESMIGGIVGIGAINQIPSRAKADYETAFEHFLGGKYGLNEEMGDEMEKEELIEKVKNLGDFGFTGDKIEFDSLLITCSTQEDNEKTPHYFVYGEDDQSEDGIFSSTNPKEIAEFVLNY
jgi:hypothetical protein